MVLALGIVGGMGATRHPVDAASQTAAAHTQNMQVDGSLALRHPVTVGIQPVVGDYYRREIWCMWNPYAPYQQSCRTVLVLIHTSPTYCLEPGGYVVPC